MGCNCSNVWSTWTLVGDTDLIMLDVKSRCEGVPLGYPDGFVGPPMAAQLPPGDDGVRPSGPCRVIYEIHNYHGVAFVVTSFSTGSDTFTFNPPIGAGQKTTIMKQISVTSPSECYTAATGVLQLVHAMSAAPQTLGEIKICRLRQPA